MATLSDTEEMEKDVKDLRKTVFEDLISCDVRPSLNEYILSKRILHMTFNKRFNETPNA